MSSRISSRCLAPRRGCIFPFQTATGPVPMGEPERENSEKYSLIASMLASSRGVTALMSHAPPYEGFGGMMIGGGSGFGLGFGLSCSDFEHSASDRRLFGCSPSFSVLMYL